MVILLYDNELLPFLDTLYASYVPSSRGVLRRGVRVSDAIAMYGKSPLFSDGWLLECDKGVKPGVVLKINAAAPENKIVVKVRSFEELNSLAVDYGDNDSVVVVDNHKLETEDVLSWIVEKLHCSTNVAYAINKRTSGRISEIINAVGMLSMLDDVTESDVKKYVSATRKVSVQDLVDWILCINQRALHREDLVQLIYDFRFAQSWLLTTISEQVGLFVKVLTLASSGEISLKNFKEYVFMSDDSELQKIPEYKMKKFLKFFGVVSLEYAFYVKNVVDSISKKDKLGMYKLIQLVKLGGNNG